MSEDVQLRNWDALYERDQLREQIRDGRAFFGFDDGGTLKFPPTFKRRLDALERGNQERSSQENKTEAATISNFHPTHEEPPRYNTKRIPSYCDRILSLHGPAAATQPTSLGEPGSILAGMIAFLPAAPGRRFSNRWSTRS